MVSTAEADLARRADFFKALGHPVRLLILNLVRQKPRHGEELALILSLNPATVSHHLAILAEAGILVSRRDQYYQTYSLVGEALRPTLAETAFLTQPRMGKNIAQNAYQDKVLGTNMFCRGTRSHLTSVSA